MDIYTNLEANCFRFVLGIGTDQFAVIKVDLINHFSTLKFWEGDFQETVDSWRTCLRMIPDCMEPDDEDLLSAVLAVTTAKTMLCNQWRKFLRINMYKKLFYGLLNLERDIVNAWNPGHLMGDDCLEKFSNPENDLF